MRFPAQHMEAFMNQFVPRWSTNNALTQRAYDALIDRFEGSIVITHSQRGNFGLTAALHNPERVKAVISLEPSGAPSPAEHDARKLRDVPHLFLWGDYLDRHAFWVHSVPNVRRWHDALDGAGADVEWIDLPARGIKGNSHALMADDNSDDIAAIVLEWLVKRRLIT